MSILNNHPLDKENDNGDVMYLQTWLDCVRDGGFIDYDGFGHLGTETHHTDLMVIPSFVVGGKLHYYGNWEGEKKVITDDDLSNFTCIIWYNK